MKIVNKNQIRLFSVTLLFSLISAGVGMAQGPAPGPVGHQRQGAGQPETSES